MRRFSPDVVALPFMVNYDQVFLCIETSSFFSASVTLKLAELCCGASMQAYILRIGLQALGLLPEAAN